MAENEEPNAEGYKTDPVYIEAKQKFADDYKKWNELSEEEKQSEDGIKLHDELSSTNDIIVGFEDIKATEDNIDPDKEDTPAIDPDVLNQPNVGLDRQGKEPEAEKDETNYHTELETKENTRYGAGKETLADEIEEGGASRHYPPSPTGDPSGFKNEYPR